MVSDDVRYKLVFNGEISGEDLTSVKNNLAALLRIDPDTIERMFQGKPIVIKKDLDIGAALKYQFTFERSGAICKVVPMVVAPVTSGEEFIAPAPVPDGSSDAKPSPSLPAPTQPRKIRCPRCLFEQSEANVCISCGIVVKKYVPPKKSFVISMGQYAQAGGTPGSSMSRRAYLGLLLLAVLIVFASGRFNSVIPGMQKDVQKLLADEAVRASAGLPKDVDPNTRLESVAAGPDKLLTYNFTMRKLSASNLDLERFRQSMMSKLRPQVCSDKVTGPFLQKGATIVYAYDGYDGNPIAKISFIQAKCP